MGLTHLLQNSVLAIEIIVLGYIRLPNLQSISSLL